MPRTIDQNRSMPPSITGRSRGPGIRNVDGNTLRLLRHFLQSLTAPRSALLRNSRLRVEVRVIAAVCLQDVCKNAVDQKLKNMIDVDSAAIVLTEKVKSFSRNILMD